MSTLHIRDTPTTIVVWLFSSSPYFFVFDRGFIIGHPLSQDLDHSSSCVKCTTLLGVFLCGHIMSSCPQIKVSLNVKYPWDVTNVLVEVMFSLKMKLAEQKKGGFLILIPSRGDCSCALTHCIQLILTFCKSSSLR